MSDPLFPVPVLLILRYMHILGAIALMGGTIFMRFALRPVVVGLPPEIKAAVHEQVRSRWAKFVMLATLLILLSGITNLALASRFNYLDKPFGMSYHMLVGIKFLVGLPIFAIAALMSGRTNLAKKMQSNAEFWMNLNLTLALIMVLMGGLLRFVKREPKAETRPQAAISAPADENASQKLPFSEPAE